jgi:NAD(P)-dependent dehydrogenase (short-subunit alcohol dehydrogenase family)
VSADVTDRKSLAGAVGELTARLGPPDVLVNNAGIVGPIDRLWDADPEEWVRTFDVNVNGAFALAQLVLPQMIARGRGRVINITSNAGVYCWPLVSAYAASKGALVNLSESLSHEVGQHGVTVLSFDPGLLPIGVTTPALTSEAPDPGTAFGVVTTWIRKRFADGRGTDPAQAVRQLVRLIAGDGDRLSGRHLVVTDDIDAILANLDQVQREDLHHLRLRTGTVPANQP